MYKNGVKIEKDDAGNEIPKTIKEEDEKEYIVNVFDFSDSLVREVMTPRIDITPLKIDASYEEFLEIYKENMYTRYPVYRDNTDDIVGIINIKPPIVGVPAFSLWFFDKYILKK